MTILNYILAGALCVTVAAFGVLSVWAVQSKKRQEREHAAELEKLREEGAENARKQEEKNQAAAALGVGGGDAQFSASVDLLHKLSEAGAGTNKN